MALVLEIGGNEEPTQVWSQVIAHFLMINIKV